MKALGELISRWQEVEPDRCRLRQGYLDIRNGGVLRSYDLQTSIQPWYMEAMIEYSVREALDEREWQWEASKTTTFTRVRIWANGQAFEGPELPSAAMGLLWVYLLALGVKL